MNNNSVKNGIIINMFYQILNIIIPFVTVPYVSRVLGPSNIGIYSYTHSLVTYFTMFAALGTISYGTREISRSRENKEELSKKFWEIELLTIFTSTCSLLVWLIFSLIYDGYTNYMIILSLLILNTMFDISWLYIGLEKFKYTVSINSFFKLMGLLLIFIFVRSDNDLMIYISLLSINTLLGTISLWFFLPKVLTKCHININNLKVHFRETLVYFIPTIAISIYTVLDKTLLGIITKDFYEIGYYEQATKVIEICKTLTFTSLNLVLGSRISYLYLKKNFVEIKTRIEKSIDYILLLSYGFIFGFLAVSDIFVVRFFGEQYMTVSLLLKILSPVILIVGISNCLGAQYYNPAGLRKKSAKYIVIGCLINLVLNIIFIPIYKNIGAIIGTIVAETIISILYIYNCDNYLSLTTIKKKSYKKIISGLIMYFILIIIKKYILNNLLLIVCTIFFAILVYLLLLLFMKDEIVYNYYLYFRNKVFKNEKI